jgi:hypothetical protein
MSCKIPIIFVQFPTMIGLIITVVAAFFSASSFLEVNVSFTSLLSSIYYCPLRYLEVYPFAVALVSSMPADLSRLPVYESSLLSYNLYITTPLTFLDTEPDASSLPTDTALTTDVIVHGTVVTDLAVYFPPVCVNLSAGTVILLEAPVKHDAHAVLFRPAQMTTDVVAYVPANFALVVVPRPPRAGLALAAGPPPKIYVVTSPYRLAQVPLLISTSNFTSARQPFAAPDIRMESGWLAFLRTFLEIVGPLDDCWVTGAMIFVRRFVHGDG